MEPMTPEQWDETSTREGLIAQLRGQRGAAARVLAELRECREENARLRERVELWEHAFVQADKEAVEWQRRYLALCGQKEEGDDAHK